MHALAHLAQITNAELVGDPAAVIRRARPFEEAQEGDITFAADAAYRARIDQSAATAIIVAPPVETTDKNLLVTPNPKLAFARVVESLHKTAYTPLGVSDDLAIGQGSVLGQDLSVRARVTVGRNTIIGDRVTLHPGVVIGDWCHIGDDTVIHANVSIYDHCQIGSRVIIHAGTVIGADGFSFVPDEQGRQVKLLQIGRVRIGDDCEIGANCAIDRAGFGDTVLGRGVKLDNFIQVGHNTEIGEDTVVAALTGFSGGTRVGRRCVIAGQVGTKQHIEIGDEAVITAKTAVIKDVKPGAVMGGMIPAQGYNAWRRSQVLYSKLPEIVERLKRLENKIKDRASDDADSE
ncbi:MAG TPA: UDP-3-O-(3-hydroxymyristoyl)glucosamine N-acyltransferase [Blastocatellia bacterium]|nr:UDP-3-O-(3-hydroxymyristoyl)glucosamine N-acyltransferase [Blastocatellia bacterium]